MIVVRAEPTVTANSAIERITDQEPRPLKHPRLALYLNIALSARGWPTWPFDSLRHPTGTRFRNNLGRLQKIRYS